MIRLDYLNFQPEIIRSNVNEGLHTSCTTIEASDEAARALDAECGAHALRRRCAFSTRLIHDSGGSVLMFRVTVEDAG